MVSDDDNKFNIIYNINYIISINAYVCLNKTFL
jgi:hypothetical protein